jgi:phosphatidylserine/phosphatidylglycerophosphate/cardiolipin synthase-like enzyme
VSPRLPNLAASTTTTAVLLVALLPLLHAGESSPAPLAPASSTSVSAPASAPAPASDGPTTGAVFSKPGDGAVRRLLLHNIRHASRGATIEVVTWTFASSGITRELLSASRRGVTVRVLVGGISCREPSVRRLARGLAHPSAARCASNSARGRSSFAGAEANLHQKSWTFSRVGSARDITIVTTANATWAADGEQYTDAYQLVGRHDVFAKMSAVFEQQWRDRPERRPFRQFRFDDGDSLMFTPWNGPHMVDPVLRRIRSLPAAGTTIRVAQSNWGDPRGVRIARALARQQRAGADVAALVSRPFSPVARQVLGRAGIPVHDAWFRPRRYHHLKFMTAAYDVAGVRSTRVWTGSENWWSPSRGHDELILELADSAAYDSYVSFFDEVAGDAGAGRVRPGPVG